ncbi:MAG: HEAT repeat domain-containing protein [Acidobacteria bacterium]|nr:HEAT repeat domain-containing protein [Acidobacteriota bacterium]MDW7983819.1 HEAT repeat domain-containing protein [Acidobacteriota bacterium]
MLSVLGPVTAQNPPLTATDWQQVLQSGSVEEKIQAAQTLADLQAIEAVPALGAALDDREPKVRFHVIRALGSIQDPAVEPFLGKALLDTDRDNRVEAYRYILAYYLGMPVPTVLQQVFPVLFRPPRAERVPWKRVHPAIVEGFRRWVQSKDSRWTLMAVQAVGRLWLFELTPDLAQLLSEPQPKDVVLGTFWSLGQIRACSALGRLLSWGQASDSDVLERAVWALAQCHREIPALGDVLWKAYSDEKKPERRSIYFRGLAYIGYAPAAPVFLQGLTSPSAEVRRYAAEGLGRLGKPENAEAVGRAFLQEEDPAIRLAMDFALFRMGRLDHDVGFVRTLQQGDATRMAQLASYVTEYAFDILPALFRYMDRLDAGTQRRLVRLAAYAEDLAVLPLLEKYLDHPDGSLAAAAFEAIKEIRQVARFRSAAPE